MKTLHQTLIDLRRPKTLIRAAQFGLKNYRRNRDLHRIIHNRKIPSTAKALAALLDQEEILEAHRVEKDARYSAIHHIRALTALMAEARRLGPS